MAKPVDIGVNTQFGTRVIRASRLKLAPELVKCLVIMAVGVLMIRIDPAGLLGLVGWLVLLFFGLVATLHAIRLVRPRALELDAQGFTLGVLLNGPARKMLWRDIDRFFVYRPPESRRKMIGYRIAPASRQDSGLEAEADGFEADAALLHEWPGSPEKMVETLNAYRRWALGTA
jgi:hypothetical protein